MERLTQKVADATIALKKMILIPFYGFIQSNSGHQFARKAGPVISCLIYLSQLVHAGLFFCVFGPEFRERYARYEPFATMMVLLGWWLCFKVTYLYYRVSTAPLATPQSVFTSDKCALALDPSLPKNMQVANYYSHDIAEVCRYTPVAVSDSETFLQLADYKNVVESEGIFCKKCQFIKPLRTHHCSVCNKCVMLMDHHCMWTNNCIGLHNYKQFLQLCGFAEVAAFYTTFLVWCVEDMDFYV